MDTILGETSEYTGAVTNVKDWGMMVLIHHDINHCSPVPIYYKVKTYFKKSVIHICVNVDHYSRL